VVQTSKSRIVEFNRPPWINMQSEDYNVAYYLAVDVVLGG